MKRWLNIQKVLVIAVFILSLLLLFILWQAYQAYKTDKEYKAHNANLQPGEGLKFKPGQRLQKAANLKVKQNYTQPKTAKLNEKGFILATYSHEQFGRNIRDLVFVNPVTTLVRLVSDNTNDFNYLDLSPSASQLSAVLYYPYTDLDDTPKNTNLALVKRSGMKIPTAHYFKRSVVLPGDIINIEISPSASFVLYQTEQEELYLADLKNIDSSTKLGNAADFSWYSDEKILLLSKNALKELRLNNGSVESKELWSFAEQQNTPKMSLSSDKNTLAIYFPDFEKLSIFNLKDDSLQERTTLNIKAKSFALSPSGRYVAVHNKVLAAGNAYNQIVIYDISGDTPKKLNLKLSIFKMFDFKNAPDFQILKWVE